MGMHDQLHILRRTAEIDGQDCFGDQRAGVRTDDVNTEDGICSSVRQHLDHPAHIAVASRSAVRGEGEGAASVGDVGRLQLFLGPADGRNFGRRLNHGWNASIVNASVSPRQSFHATDPIERRLVCQHGSGDDIADRVNAVYCRLEAFAHRHPALLVKL